MRRRRKKSSLTLKIIFMIVTFMAIISLGYSYLSLVLKISGNVTGKMTEISYTLAPKSDTNLNLKLYQIGTQTQNNTYIYHYSLNVKNVGTSTINGFAITFATNSIIRDISALNYSYTIANKNFTITGPNKILNSGESTMIDLTVTVNTSNLLISSIKLEGLGVIRGNVDVAFTITSSTDSYVYNYNVTITNNTGVKTTTWQIDITLPEGTSYISGSGAIFTYLNNIITIKNDKSNGKINNGSSITVTLKLSTNIINYIPNNIKITTG